jgi:hypothetical protein
LWEIGDAEVSHVCDFYDDAVWEGDLVAVAVRCGSDIIEVMGNFEEMSGGSGVNDSWWGGGR